MKNGRGILFCEIFHAQEVNKLESVYVRNHRFKLMQKPKWKHVTNFEKNRKRLLIFLFQMDKNAYGYISIVSIFALIYRLSNYILIIFWSLNRNNYRRSTKFKRSGDFFYSRSSKRICFSNYQLLIFICGIRVPLQI